MAISKGDLALCADELRSMGFDAGRLTISVRDYVLSRVCQLIRMVRHASMTGLIMS